MISKESDRGTCVFLNHQMYFNRNWYNQQQVFVESQTSKEIHTMGLHQKVILAMQFELSYPFYALDGVATFLDSRT